MTSKKFLLCVSTIFAALIFCGCASIVSKNEYLVTICTNAPEATVTVRDASNGMVVGYGIAPLSLMLKTNCDVFQAVSYVCEVKSREGRIQVQSINANFNPWFLGNFFIGGLIGMIIDGATGAVFRLDENVYIHFNEYAR